MKDLSKTLNEARNIPYHVALATKYGIITVTMELEKLNDGYAVDYWLEEMKDNGIYAADGGPNDIEI